MLKLVHNADVLYSSQTGSNLMTLKERINKATDIKASAPKPSMVFPESPVKAEKTSA